MIDIDDTINRMRHLDWPDDYGEFMRLLKELTSDHGDGATLINKVLFMRKYDTADHYLEIGAFIDATPISPKGVWVSTFVDAIPRLLEHGSTYLVKSFVESISRDPQLFDVFVSQLLLAPPSVKQFVGTILRTWRDDPDYSSYKNAAETALARLAAR